MIKTQPFGGQTSRQNDKIVVFLSQDQPVPDLVPYELYEHIYPDEWQMRLTAIKTTVFRYYKPRLERLWYIISAISVIVFPLIIYRVVFNALINSNPPNERPFFRARAIAFSSLIVLTVLLWTPLLIWKWIPARKIRSLLRGWAETDRMTKQHTGFIPIWSISQPSAFRPTCIVSVTIPPNARPTVFHPSAYLPSFVNAPPNAGPMYYGFDAPGQPGAPYMNAPPYEADLKANM